MKTMINGMVVTVKKNNELFAEAQTWVFNNNIHGTVKEVVRKETKEERKAREEAEAKAKAEKKAKREEAKAEAMGMTVEEYKAHKKAEANKKRTIKCIEMYEKEIAEKIAEIERLKERIERMRKEIEE